MGYRFNKTEPSEANQVQSNEIALKDNLLYSRIISPLDVHTNVAPTCLTNRAQKLPVNSLLLSPSFIYAVGEAKGGGAYETEALRRDWVALGKD